MYLQDLVLTCGQIYYTKIYTCSNLTLVFVLFAWSSLTSTYLMSFLFTVPASGYVWLTVFNIFTGKSPLILALPYMGVP